MAAAFVGEGSATDSNGTVRRGTWGDRGNGQWGFILTEEPATKKQRELLVFGENQDPCLREHKTILIIQTSCV